MIAHPEDIAGLFAKAWNENDAEGIASLFAEDAEFVNVTGLWWHKRKSILKAHRYGLDTIFQDATATIKRIKIKWLNNDIAVVHAKMELSGQTAVGDIKNPGNRQNIFSFVMQNTHEGWLCVSAHNTDILPGKETIIRNETGNAKGVDYRGRGSEDAQRGND